MQAKAASLLRLLDGEKQFIVPVYQRTYQWDQKQCRALWNDVKKAGRDDSIHSHFISSIVYIQDGPVFAAGVQTLLVIDGQQRLTTVALLLAALAREAEVSTEDLSFTAEQIQERYLINKFDKDRYCKVLLRRDDRDHLRSIIDSRESTNRADSEESNVYENFSFFQKWIRDSLRYGNITLGQVYKGISKLAVVDVTLDRQADNPQIIFESLNDAGLRLSQADLVRNYVLMGLDPNAQETLYENSWQPMERVLKDGPRSSKRFDSFIRDYLTMKLGRRPIVNEVYDVFKEYVNSPNDMSETVQDMYEYSGRYAKIIGLDKDVPEIQQVLQDINDRNRLNVEVARPFLLKVYGDYAEGVISKDDFVKVLHLVESFVVRRRVCGVKDNALGRVFTSLISELDERHHVESFERALVRKEDVRRFPMDSEFRSNLISRSIYNPNSPLTKYLLEKLENLGRKEKVNVNNYTIEHIMPQKEHLSREWKQELGEERWSEVHGEYLHTLGNLTLTGYNAELGARSFKEKRNMEGGYRDTPIRLSREYLAKVERWDEKAIKSRAELLADIALKIWIAPKAPRADTES